MHAGGGYAGIRAVKELSAKFDVTLVDPKAFWEMVPAAVDGAVVAGAANLALVDFPASITRKQDLVVAITSGEC